MSVSVFTDDNLVNFAGQIVEGKRAALAHKLNFGARSFRVAAPTVWNSLPADIRACTFYSSFIRQLKTFYFNNAF